MRKVIIAISGCIVMLLLGYTGYRGYKVWKQNHLVAMAKTFAARFDARNELLCLQQALQVNPRNLEACRLMAGLTEAGRSGSALVWRERVVELNPRSLEDRLALVNTALAFRDYASASNALAGADEPDRQTSTYQNIAGVVAIALGQMPEAEKHFGEAVRLDPLNPSPALNLAVLRLRGSNALDLAAARADMKQISATATNFSLRAQATRELIVDAMRFKDYAGALTLSRELASPTNAIFSDKIARLTVLKVAQSPELEAAIGQYQREAAADPAKLDELTPWLAAQISPASALAWLRSLPVQTQTNQPAALLIAECQVDLQDWAGLQGSLTKQNWAEQDFYRHAFLARALRAKNLGGASTGEWELALKSANEQKYISTNKGALRALYNLAAAWKWRDEAEETLWAVVNRYPEESSAAITLQDALVEAGRTRPLMQLLSIQTKRFPANLGLKNDLALVAMLLGSQEIDPYRMAREVYEKAPQNPYYASTHAFALYLQKQYADALKVMQQINLAQLNDAQIAGYYGLILKATGNGPLAKTYLAMPFSKKAKLLPEEQKMFQQAMAN